MRWSFAAPYRKCRKPIRLDESKASEFITDPAQLDWIENNLLTSIQTMFLHALIMVTTPMIFFSVVSGFSSMSDAADVGRIIARFIPLPFSMCDSTACMPATLSFCTEKLGMSDKFTKFSIPVGMQLNMDGTAFYVAIVSMMLAHTFGIPMDAEFCASFFFAQFIIALTGIGLIAMPSLLAAFGIPEVAITVVIGIEPILDMFGTAQSVAGNITSSFLVGRLEHHVDEETYCKDT